MYNNAGKLKYEQFRQPYQHYYIQNLDHPILTVLMRVVCTAGIQDGLIACPSVVVLIQLRLLDCPFGTVGLALRALLKGHSHSAANWEDVRLHR